jgi:hypothetical protein
MDWPLKRTLALWVLLGGLVAKASYAQNGLPAGFLEAQLNERGEHCDKRAIQQADGKLFVACGPAGAWEIALAPPAPRFVKSYEFSAPVVGFFTEADGRLWVKLQVLEARPLTSAGSAGAPQFPDPPPAPSSVAGAVAPSLAGPPPPAPAPSAAAAPGRGQVVKSTPGEVVISLGTRDGLARGDRIELALEHPDADAPEDAALSREVLAVGVVTNVTERSAKIRLGVNESAPVGTWASRAQASPTASESAPPRVTDITTLELMVRPFAALGELGGGFLLSGAIGHRFGHLHLWALLDPVAAAAVEKQDGVTAANGALMVSYDSQFFEMGLGLGAQTVNSMNFIPPGSGLTVAQLLRLGPADGLNVTFRTSIVLFHSQFDFGGMVGTAQFPVTRGYWLLLGGGGGSVGYGYGEVGLRVLASGNGLAGSKFLTLSAGGAAVFRSRSCDQIIDAVSFASCNQSVAFGGPMVGLGGEWRF